MKENLVGLIDLGSNSIRLVVYRIDNHGEYKEVKRAKVTARLINYLNAKGNLTKEGIHLILKTLKGFKKLTQAYKVDVVRGFATAVLREASNQRDVLKEIKKQTDYSFRVLSEDEEAYYGYLGVIQSMDIEEGITIDCGGGSTEITWFKERKLMKSHSFPFGTITLNREFTNEKQVSEKQIDHLKAYLASQFNTLSWLEQVNGPVIGMGGNARNLTRIYQNKYTTKQNSIKLDQIGSIFEELSSLPMNKRSNIKGLSKKRQDLIIPGVLTIGTLMDIVQAPYFVFSDTTIRDGILYEEFINRRERNLG